MSRENLKDARKAAGLTQQAMAEKLGVSLRHYQRLEAGTSAGTVDLWDRIEDVFQLPQRFMRKNKD